MTFPRVLLGVFVVLALGVAAVAVAGLVGAARQPTPLVRESGAEAVAPAPEVPAAAMLATWDAARAEAWADGDVRRLRDLYTRDSVAGRRDRAMLRAWVARGLVVRGLTTQVLELAEVRRSHGRWVIRVTDRVAAGSAVGRTTRPLPRDSATTTTLTFRRVDGDWLVASVHGG